MIARKHINGEDYLRISDVAELSGVEIRTMRRWINDGDLTHFLTVYRSESGIQYFRLGIPHDTDVLIEGETFRYHLPVENSIGGSS